jgi:hypothetical protein
MIYQAVQDKQPYYRGAGDERELQKESVGNKHT